MNTVKMGFTIEEAAECTGIGRNTMRKLVDWGKLPVLKVWCGIKKVDSLFSRIS